jgi:tRNA G46 methylase TrmB
MSKNWFEQNLNKKLSGSAEDFDLDASWKAIQAKRSKKKRRVIYFWFVLPAVLILLAGGSLYLSTDQDRLMGQETISDKPIPLASGNIESEKIESATQNEVQSNTDLNSTAIPQTVKNDEKNGLQKHFKTTPQKTEIAQTNEILKAPINLHS